MASWLLETNIIPRQDPRSLALSNSWYDNYNLERCLLFTKQLDGTGNFHTTRMCDVCSLRYKQSQGRMFAQNIREQQYEERKRINESQRLYEIKACNLEMDWDSTMSRGYQMDG